MGLFDFVTKTKSSGQDDNAQGDQSQTTQTSTTTPQAQPVTPFSDVKYPMPGAAPVDPNGVVQNMANSQPQTTLPELNSSQLPNPNSNFSLPTEQAAPSTDSTLNQNNNLAPISQPSVLQPETQSSPQNNQLDQQLNQIDNFLQSNQGAGGVSFESSVAPIQPALPDIQVPPPPAPQSPMENLGNELPPLQPIQDQVSSNVGGDNFGLQPSDSDLSINTQQSGVSADLPPLPDIQQPQSEIQTPTPEPAVASENVTNEKSSGGYLTFNNDTKEANNEVISDGGSSVQTTDPQSDINNDQIAAELVQAAKLSPSDLPDNNGVVTETQAEKSTPLFDSPTIEPQTGSDIDQPQNQSEISEVQNESQTAEQKSELDTLNPDLETKEDLVIGTSTQEQPAESTESADYQTSGPNLNNTTDIEPSIETVNEFEPKIREDEDTNKTLNSEETTSVTENDSSIAPAVESEVPTPSVLPPLPDIVESEVGDNSSTKTPEESLETEPQEEDKSSSINTAPAAVVATTEESKVLDNKFELPQESRPTFRKFAFVGLNVEKVNAVVADKINNLVLELSQSNGEIILDSSKGYGERILFSMKDQKNRKIKGVYLRPFYSDYTDESRSKFNMPGYSTVLFSSLDSKIKYLIKSSDLFIMPETAGFNNLSLLFTLLTNSYFYYGQHKPVILIGKEWEKIFNSLKNLWQFNEAEMKSINICPTPEDAVKLIHQLEEDYKDKPSIDVRKVADFRNESEESHYFVNRG